MFSVGQIGDSEMLINLRGRVSPSCTGAIDPLWIQTTACRHLVKSDSNIVLFFILPYTCWRKEAMLSVLMKKQVGLIGCSTNISSF